MARYKGSRRPGYALSSIKALRQHHRIPTPKAKSPEDIKIAIEELRHVRLLHSLFVAICLLICYLIVGNWSFSTEVLDDLNAFDGIVNASVPAVASHAAY